MEKRTYKKVPVNLEDVRVDIEIPKKKRIESFLHQVKNPYLMYIDGVLVEMEYKGSCSMQDQVELAIAMDNY